MNEDSLEHIDAASPLPNFHALSGYRWWSALAAAVVILAIAVITAQLLGRYLLELLGLDRSVPPRDWQDGMQALLMAKLAIVQFVTIILVLGAARWRSQGALQALSLDHGPTIKTLAWTIFGMLAVLLPYNAVVFSLSPTSAAQDLRPFIELMHSDARWLAALTIGVGAPISEELLFRGFLLPSLAQTGLRFTGAAFLTTFMWAALHAGYTFAGLIEVSLIGLYFSFVIWRWGSLWLTIVAHSLYNGLLLCILSFTPV